MIEINRCREVPPNEAIIGVYIDKSRLALLLVGFHLVPRDSHLVPDSGGGHVDNFDAMLSCPKAVFYILVAEEIMGIKEG